MALTLECCPTRGNRWLLVGVGGFQKPKLSMYAYGVYLGFKPGFLCPYFACTLYAPRTCIWDLVGNVTFAFSPHVTSTVLLLNTAFFACATTGKFEGVSIFALVPRAAEPSQNDMRACKMKAFRITQLIPVRRLYPRGTALPQSEWGGVGNSGIGTPKPAKRYFLEL